MKRAVMSLGLVVLSAGQVGCTLPGHACDVPNNGNQGVLNFSGWQSPAHGLVTEVRVLRWHPELIRGPGQGPWTYGDASECFAFEGAEIQVELPASFQGEVATVEQSPGQDAVIQFRCTAPVGEPQVVPVRVVENGELQQEDSFTVTCQAVESAKVTLEAPTNQRPVFGNKYVVGGLMHVSYTLLNRSGDEMGGVGATSADGLLAPEGTPDARLQTQSFRVVAPGQSPALQVGSIRVEVPVALVGNDGWALKLEMERAASFTDGVFAFSAWPVTPEGDKLDGLSTCQWTAFTANGSEELLDTACDLRFSTQPGTDGAVTKMCVKSMERTACAEVK